MLRHSPTGEEVHLSDQQASSVEEPADAAEYARRIAAAHVGRLLPDLVDALYPTPDRAAASAAVARLLDLPSSHGDGVTWKRGGGNVLKVGGVAVASGYEGYELSQAEEHSDEEQRRHTLRIERKGYEALVRKRDMLALGVSNLPRLAEEGRHGAAFVIGAVYLLEEMQREAGGAPLIDAHAPDSANPHGAFEWHVDDHAEQDGGAYIERTIVCQCSEGDASMVVAGVGEVKYRGVGGFVSFPGWAPHRTMRVEPVSTSMWKLAGFFAPKDEEVNTEEGADDAGIEGADDAGTEGAGSAQDVRMDEAQLDEALVEGRTAC